MKKALKPDIKILWDKISTPDIALFLTALMEERKILNKTNVTRGTL